MTILKSVLSLTFETWWVAAAIGVTLGIFMIFPVVASGDGGLDKDLEKVLKKHGFTGDVERALSERLGRPLDPALIELGGFLFFDPIMSLRNDNGCAGSHTTAFGFGDPQSVAYGVANDGIVGPNRDDTRNERKTPISTDTAFLSKLMLNGPSSSAVVSIPPAMA